jgi:hypothetical protein
MRDWVSTGDIKKLFTIDQRKVSYWTSRGVIRPSMQARQRGQHHAWSVIDTLGIALSLDLRQRGFGLDQAAAVCGWLRDQTLPALRKEWERGHRYLLCVGEMVHPGLLSREHIEDNPAIDLFDACANGLPVAVLDIESAYKQLIARIQELRGVASTEASIN